MVSKVTGFLIIIAFFVGLILFIAPTVGALEAVLTLLAAIGVTVVLVIGLFLLFIK